MTGMDRRGYTLAEALTALLVAGVLTLCLAAVLAAVGRVALQHAQTTTAAETERTVAAILGAELRTVTAADVTFAHDSVRLRAFRGRGVVCAAGPDEIVVSYSGVRMPEDDKDSVLVLRERSERAFDLDGAFAGGDCVGESLRLVLPGFHADTADPPVMALVFETGAYSIASSAFRYRRGSAGRQPLTEENLSTATSGIEVVSRAGGGAAAVVTLRPPRTPRGAAMTWSLGMLQGAVRP